MKSNKADDVSHLPVFFSQVSALITEDEMSRKWSALILFKQTDKKHRGGVAWSCGGALLSSVGAAWLNSYCCQTCSTSSGFYGWGDKMKASQSQSGWSVFWGKRWWSEELSPGQSLCLWSQPGLGLYPKESQRGERLIWSQFITDKQSSHLQSIHWLDALSLNHSCRKWSVIDSSVLDRHGGC